MPTSWSPSSSRILMTKLTWRGPDDYEAGETPPSSCTWNGITFPVGVAVEVDNPTMIAKARGNRMFKVEGEPQKVQWREPATEADPADVSFFDDPPEVPLDMPPARDAARLPAGRRTQAQARAPAQQGDQRWRSVITTARSRAETVAYLFHQRLCRRYDNCDAIVRGRRQLALAGAADGAQPIADHASAARWRCRPTICSGARCWDRCDAYPMSWNMCTRPI